MSKHKREQTKAIAYIRVAAPVQKEEELSIQNQKQQILKAAEHMNFEIVRWFIQEGYEPIGFRNGVLNQAVEYCQDDTAIKYLVVANISRLSRSLDHCIYWQVVFEGLGVTIKTADDVEFDSPEESLAASISAMFAQYEQERRSEMLDEYLKAKKVKKA